MAYVSQDLKKQLAPTIKEICKKYGVKATIAVRNNSTLVLNIKEGKIDFIGNHVNTVGTDCAEWAIKQGCIDVNPYHYEKHFSGNALAFLSEVIPAMNVGNYNDSDIQVDYFSVGWYVDVNIGNWNKPYTHI